MHDSISLRLKRKAFDNRLAIAVGSSSSPDACSIPRLAEELISTYGIDFSVVQRGEFFEKWNELVKKAEEAVGREELVRFVGERVKGVKPMFTHRMIASVPISNFIDTTFDRSLYKALMAAGKEPVTHDWGRSQAMGIWKQGTPEKPNVFFSLPNVEGDNASWGVYEQIGRLKQNRIQFENLADMLSVKDLVLINFPADEAESVLHLSWLITSCEKVINYAGEVRDADYWARLGVCMREQGAEELIARLVPHHRSRYSEWMAS